jgi:hypothetical protein
MDACILTITIKACSKYQKDGEYNYHAALEIELVCEHHPTIHLYDPIGSIDPFATEEQAMSSAEAWLGEIANQEKLIGGLRQKFAE